MPASPPRPEEMDEEADAGDSGFDDSDFEDSDFEDSELEDDEDEDDEDAEPAAGGRDTPE